jgi:hypothetical protein
VDESGMTGTQMMTNDRPENGSSAWDALCLLLNSSSRNKSL